MNYARIVLGGLLAGLVLNVCDAAGQMILFKQDAQAMVERLHLDPAVVSSPAGMIPWVLADFFFGIIIIFNYAAIRPRFGPGPTTALMAGMMTYAALTVFSYGFTSMGIFESTAFVKQSAFYFVNVALASLAGAWLYKEN